MIIEKVEEYFGHILNGGSGRPMQISLEEVAKDVINLLKSKTTSTDIEEKDFEDMVLKNYVQTGVEFIDGVYQHVGYLKGHELWLELEPHLFNKSTGIEGTELERNLPDCSGCTYDKDEGTHQAWSKQHFYDFYIKPHLSNKSELGVETKEVLSLIRSHYEKNEVSFRNTAKGISEKLRHAGKDELALYVLAQLGETRTFTTEDLSVNKSELKKEAVEGFIDLCEHQMRLHRAYIVPSDGVTHGLSLRNIYENQAYLSSDEKNSKLGGKNNE